MMPLNYLNRHYLLLAALLPGFSTSSYAETEFALPLTEQSRLHISGFGTLGLTTSDTKNLTLTRDIGDLEGISTNDFPMSTDSRLGLQVDAIVNSHWSASVQAVVKDRPEQTFEQSLQWAFVNYRPNQNWQIRAGRIGFDSFLLSDQRNVGYTQLWVRPPIEFYGRLPLYFFDGGDVKYRQSWGELRFESKLFAGKSAPVIPSDVVASAPLQLDPVWGGNADLYYQNWHLRLGYTSVTINSPVVALQQLATGFRRIAKTGVYPEATNLANTLEFHKTQNHFLSIGLAYEHDPWQIQAEFNQITYGPAFQPDSYAAYLSTGYRIKRWTPYLMYARTWFAESSNSVKNANPAIQPMLEPLLDGARKAFNHDIDNQETVSIGTRWDISDHLALKTQYDLVHVRDNGYGLWKGRFDDPPKPDAFYNVFSLTLDFVF